MDMFKFKLKKGAFFMLNVTNKFVVLRTLCLFVYLFNFKSMTGKNN